MQLFLIILILFYQISSEISPNLVTNGDAEYGTHAWSWNKLTGNLQTTSYANINITRGKNFNSKTRLSLGTSCFQAKYIAMNSSRNAILVAKQLRLIPVYLKNSTLHDLTNFKLTTDFIRYFGSKDFVRINLSFLNSQNKRLLFNKFNVETLKSEYGYVDVLGGEVYPFLGNNSAEAFFFSHVSNGTVPVNAVSFLLEMEFHIFETRDIPVSKAFVDNIEIDFYYTRDRPRLAIESPKTEGNTISVLGYVGIAVGGLGVFLLFIIVPIFMCFRTQSNPIAKRFTLKRRNSKVSLLMERTINRLNSLTKSRRHSFPPRTYHPKNMAKSSMVPIKEERVLDF
ncbi:hypothetical protein HDU92_007857 [Lobulomyces angularis]|nr:hypothetical protein HDU92_007857 [Lobulomyces angularis]